jgi:hypothetical protein
MIAKKRTPANLSTKPITVNEKAFLDSRKSI